VIGGRRSAKALVKAAATRTIGRRLAGDLGSRVVVLCYHSIHPRKSFATAAPEQFARHLDWLCTNCEIVPLRQVMDVAANRSGRPRVALTFDDGYEDNYTYAFPLLSEYRATATVFLTIGALERDASVLAKLRMLRGATDDDIAPLEWTQVAEMRQNGIEFGSHTYSHANLARLSYEDARLELARSKAIMEERLDAAVDSLAYPFGKPQRHFTRETVTLARAVGYERAAAVLFRRVRATDDVYAIPRFFVDESVPALIAKVRGDWDLVGAWQELAPEWLARIVSPVDYDFR
jgi:peptidoglycan/xylan/chitin deacetylase (PgdA/CDA1 family)